MYLAVIGSRKYPNLKLVRDFVMNLAPTIIVVSGGARGVDETAAKAHTDVGGNPIIFYADWEKYDNRAGPIRNREVVDFSEVVVAFWDGDYDQLHRSGTMDAVTYAVSKDRSVYLFGIKGNILDVLLVVEAYKKAKRERR